MTFDLNNPQRFLLICLSFMAFTTAISGQFRLTLMENENQLKTISFEKGLFEQFYDCLCNKTTLGCTVFYDDLNFNALYINPLYSFDTPGNSSSEEFSNYFKCVYDNVNNKPVMCERQRQDNVSCDQPSFLTSFRLLPPISGDVTCIGLMWSDQRESLISSTSNQLETCKGDCSEESTTVSIANVTNSTVKTAGKDSDDNANVAAVVVGVVLGLLLLTSVVIIAILLWRMRRSGLEQFDSGTDSKMTDKTRTSTEMKGISGDIERKEREENKEDDNVYENTGSQNQSGNYISASTAPRNANVPNKKETSHADTTYTNQEAARAAVQVTSSSNYSQSAPPLNTYSQLNEGMFPSGHSYEQLSKSPIDSQVSGTYSNSPNNDTYEDV